MSSCQITSEEFILQPSGESQDRNLTVAPSSRRDDRIEWALLGESIAVRQLRSQIRRIAPHFRTGLIRGESGTGKELVARAIHALSPGSEGPFIVADARLLAEPGDHNHALSRHSTLNTARMLESARGGTLYLPPVGDLSHLHQAALMRLLQISEERRVDVGRSVSQNPTTRILVASGRDFRILSAIGQFRADLYSRLSAVEIFVPSLRQRTEDVPSLAEWLLRQIAEEGGQSPKRFSEFAMLRLQQLPWPNNLREFERVVKEAAGIANGTVIEVHHLPTLVDLPLPHTASSPELKVERLHEVMQRHVVKVLTQCGGNKVRAADLLGISRSTLYRMLGATPYPNV